MQGSMPHCTSMSATRCPAPRADTRRMRAVQNTLGVHGDVTQQFYYQTGDSSPCNPCLQQYNFVVTEVIQDVGSVGRCDWCASHLDGPHGVQKPHALRIRSPGGGENYSVFIPGSSALWNLKPQVRAPSDAVARRALVLRSLFIG